MTDEMKLLMALCDALGFEVEKVATAKSIKERDEYIRLGCGFGPKLEYEYKLTKRQGVVDYKGGRERGKNKYLEGLFEMLECGVISPAQYLERIRDVK